MAKWSSGWSTLPTKNISQELRKAGRRVRGQNPLLRSFVVASQFCGLTPKPQFLDSWVPDLLRYSHEIRAGGRDRQDAERLHLFPHETGGTRISPRIHARADAEANARARRVRREIHDRLPEESSGELVQAREALA